MQASNKHTEESSHDYKHQLEIKKNMFKIVVWGADIPELPGLPVTVFGGKGFLRTGVGLTGAKGGRGGSGGVATV